MPPVESIEGPFSKSSSLQMGIKFFGGSCAWANLLGDSSTCEINDQIMPRVGEFYKYIF